MSIYVDSLSYTKPNSTTSYCHMIATTLEELHWFAEQVGINRCWFHRTSKPHYDLNAKNRALALAGGAFEITSRDLVILGRATLWGK